MPDAATLQSDICAALEQRDLPAGLFAVDVRAECASTNSTLLELAESGASSGTVVVARHQSAGRGRRGRHWVSAPGDSLTFSLLWRFAPGTSPSGLSLAVGVALVRALSSLAAQATPGAIVPAGALPALSLKWPNDLLLDERKLAGVLVELVPGKPHAAVIGIGLNRQLPEALPAELRESAAAWPYGTAPADLLATLLLHLAQVLEQFAGGGFAVLRSEWQSHHAHQDQAVSLLDELAAPRQGICRGVAPDGALLLETTAGIERVLSGEVSLRPARP